MKYHSTTSKHQTIKTNEKIKTIKQTITQLKKQET